MFLGYVDESADQTEKKIFVVGGFLGHYEQWSALERRWKELLEKYEIYYYHAVEAQHARKQFAKPPYRTNPDPSARLTQEQCRFLENVRKDFCQPY